MDIVLSNKIVVLSKKNSKSDLWDIVDSFPCLLELSVGLTSTNSGQPFVKVENKQNGKSDSSLTITKLSRVLFYCEIQ